MKNAPPQTIAAGKVQLVIIKAFFRRAALSLDIR
jgi:hypothetical protein